MPRISKQADARAIRRRILDGEQHRASDLAEIKRGILALVEQAIDARIGEVGPGDGLGIVFRVERLSGQRYSPQAHEWREAIFRRDGFRCAECGARGRLNAHHLVAWSEAPESRYDLANGITLCIDCHASRHPKQANLIRKARYHGGKGHGWTTDEAHPEA